MRSSVVVAAGFVALVLAPGRGPAQPQRYELGQRLKAFETAWDEAKPDAAARQRAAGHLGGAVRSFFGARAGAAGRSLDRARFALTYADVPPDPLRWAAALAVRPRTRLVAADASELPVQLVESYPADAPRPVTAVLRLTLTDAAGKPVGRPVQADIRELPLTVALPLADVGPGDYWLRAEVAAGRETLTTARIQVSRVRAPEKRLDALREAVEKADGQRTAVLETLQSRLGLLEGLLRERVYETDYPADRLFAEAESLLPALRAGTDEPLVNRPGDHWRTLPAGDRPTPVRLFAPDGVAAAKSVPLVIALHGAGGSENLFFEGYGAGGIVRLCRERGWLLVAPRGGGFGRSGHLARLTDAVAKLYPAVDRNRVFVVGHSMGAMAALGELALSPQPFRAVAALGGGVALNYPAAAARSDVFLGCGEADLALRQVRATAAALRKVEGMRAELKEYAGVEHLAIVQAALPDVFARFDALAK